MPQTTTLHSSASCQPHYQTRARLFTQHPLVLMSVLFVILLLFPDFAHASSTGMPWESPLTKLVESITGPVAFGISVLALVASVAGLVFGGELSGLIKNMLFLALGISVIVFATNMLRSLGSSPVYVVG